MSLSLATVAKMLELIGEVERLTAKLAECRAVLKEREFDGEDGNSCGGCGSEKATAFDRRTGGDDEPHDPGCPWLRAMTDEEPKQ